MERVSQLSELTVLEIATGAADLDTAIEMIDHGYPFARQPLVLTTGDDEIPDFAVPERQRRRKANAVHRQCAGAELPKSAAAD